MSIARSYLTIIAGLAGCLLIACRQEPPPPSPPLRLALPPVDELVLDAATDYPFGLALAPDGRQLVMAAARAGAESRLWLRDLTSGELRSLDHTEGAVLPFWSPDGAAVGFFADGKLRTLEIASGRVSDLADAPSPRGATWLAGGDIIYAPDSTGGLVRRANAGGVSAFTALESGESSHRLPQALDDEHVIFYVQAAQSARQGIWIASRTQPSARRRLTTSDAAGLTSNGALVYSHGGALVAQRVDVDTLSLSAKPHLLATTVGHGVQHQLFATAGGDVLIHGTPAASLRELQWRDRSGAVVGLVGEPMTAGDVRVAPRGAQVAVARVDPQLNTLDVWTYDGARPLPRRVSPSINIDDAPAWSRDGTRVAWVHGRQTVSVRDARAETPEIALRKFDRPIRVTDWTDDDQWIVLSETQSDSRGDIRLMRARPDGETVDYLRTPFHETAGVVSPDGRWLAYVSDESGHPEIYVDAFPRPRSRARLTLGGGEEPRWSRDGRQVFFRRGREIHVIGVAAAGDTLEALASERLFDAGAEIRSFDSTPGGDRFLLNMPAPGTGPRPLMVLLNVSSLLPSAQ